MTTPTASFPDALLHEPWVVQHFMDIWEGEQHRSHYDVTPTTARMVRSVLHLVLAHHGRDATAGRMVACLQLSAVRQMADHPEPAVTPALRQALLDHLVTLTGSSENDQHELHTLRVVAAVATLQHHWDDVMERGALREALSNLPAHAPSIPRGRL